VQAGADRGRTGRPGVDATAFRAVLGQWPSGVAVVTTLAPDGSWHGMTASSFSSVSLDPPLVSICLAKTATSHDLITASGLFAVNILAKDQVEVGKRFAGMVEGVTDRFAGVATTTARTGAPLLPDVLGWVDCEVRHAYAGGDHTIFVGEVLAADAPRTAPPLLYHSRTWGQFADVLPEEVRLTRERAATTLNLTGDDLAPPGKGPVTLVDPGTATPAQVRDRVRAVVAATRPREVRIRLSAANPMAPASLLTALRSGLTVVEVGDGAIDSGIAAALLQGLDVRTVT
jgi:flavin reductase (DIM6/NTAB) family NADH-FMN oxidoreductase RutF